MFVCKKNTRILQVQMVDGTMTVLKKQENMDMI